jgi:outer membrane protein OmpA-like peptidoglycan-associated protein
MRCSLLFTVIACLAASPAFAQVTVDLHALDALPHRPSAPRPALRRPRAPRRVEALARPAGPLPRPAPVVSPASPSTEPAAPSTAPAAPSTAPAAPSTTPAAPAATLPAAPPSVASIPPVSPPPAPASAGPPPAPPVVAAAKTVAAKIPAGLQLTFASGESDLSPGSAAAIKRFVQASLTGKGTAFNVLAYAANVANDPSAPRRLSLSRAVSVRTAMVADGVASDAIYMRALGARGGAGPPDRVDISVTGGSDSPGVKSQ